MNAQFMLLCLAVVLMTATESSNAFVKRALRKKQEDVTDQEVEDFLEFLAGLEELAKELEAEFGDMAPVKRALRKRQMGDDFGMTDEDWEELLTALEQLEELAKQLEESFGEMKRRRRR